MKGIFEDMACTGAPVQNYFWNTTSTSGHFGALETKQDADVSIVGAGFTGISAAYHLARKNISVILLDAEAPLFGATGRNGGFCCLDASRRAPWGLTGFFEKANECCFLKRKKRRFDW